MTTLNMTAETAKPAVAPIPGDKGKTETVKPADPAAPASATPKP